MTTHWILLVATGLLSQADTPQLPLQKISQIVVRGNVMMNREAIKSMTGLKVGDPITKTAIDQARQNLVATGNFGAGDLSSPADGVKVTASSDPDATVTIEVEENPVVKEISLVNSGPLSASDLRSVIETKPGLILNLNTLRTDIAAVQQLYSKRGYMGCVTEELRLKKEALYFTIAVGRMGEYRLGTLPPKLRDAILKSVKLKPGTYFHRPTFESDVERIRKVCARFGYSLKTTVSDFESTCHLGSNPRPCDIPLTIERTAPGRAQRGR